MEPERRQLTSAYLPLAKVLNHVVVNHVPNHVHVAVLCLHVSFYMF